MASMCVTPVVVAGVRLRSVVTHWQWLKLMVSPQPFFNGMYVLGLNLTSPLLQCKVYQVVKGKRGASLKGSEAEFHH